MNDWAWAEGADTIAKVATAAAINFDVMNCFLPGFGRKVDGCVPRVNPCHRPRRTHSTIAKASPGRDNAPKVWSGNLLPCRVKPASMRRNQKGQDEQQSSAK
jgi:hypothetical protein